MRIIENLKVFTEQQFDPKKVDIRTQHFTVDEIMKRIMKGEFDGIGGDLRFQRKSQDWSSFDRSILIESLMIGIPMPSFFFDGSEMPWRVIDGRRRLQTIFDFIHGDRFPLSELEFMTKQYGDSRFVDLPYFMQIKILETPIEAIILNPGTQPGIRHSIFSRINSQGAPMNSQEIREAAYRGSAASFVRDLAMEPIFQAVIGNYRSLERILDRELVTRFLAFQRFRELYNGNMDEFLRWVMEWLCHPEYSNREILRVQFLKAMQRVLDLLGPNCFTFPNARGEYAQKSPSKALFDTLSWNISELSGSQYQQLLNSNSNFKTKFREWLMLDSEFRKAINHRKSTKETIAFRFSALEKFIQQCL